MTFLGDKEFWMLTMQADIWAHHNAKNTWVDIQSVLASVYSLGGLGLEPIRGGFL